MPGVEVFQGPYIVWEEGENTKFELYDFLINRGRNRI